MENKKVQERVLAFTLATEITEDEMGQVSGGWGTRAVTTHTTMAGNDHTFDYDSD